MATCVPDVGDTFTVTTTWRCRRWRWLPGPSKTLTDTRSYRVTGWLMRRPPRQPDPDPRLERIYRDLAGELPPRGSGPDNVPLMFCRRQQAEYVSGYGVRGTIQRVRDVTVDGRVPWGEATLAGERDLAELLAGQALW